MIGDFKVLKCSNLLFGETGCLSDNRPLQSHVHHPSGSFEGLLLSAFLSTFLSTFLSAFLSTMLLGVADLVAYVSFRGHGVFVFDLVLGSKCSNICHFKQ